MSFNAIRSKVKVGTIMKGGKEITLSVAKETSTWKRTEEVARSQGPAFKAAVENTLDAIKDNTKEIVARESQHPSSDPRDHFTGVQFSSEKPDNDVGTDGSSAHFYVKK